MIERPTVTRTTTHVGGERIIATEPATGVHPHPSQKGAIVPFKGVTKALLEDDSVVWLCDGVPGQFCPFVGNSTKSVVAHRNGTHNLRQPRRASRYSDAVLRRIAQEVAIARQAGSKDFAVRAAQALNDAGLQTLRGELWTGSMVSSVFNAHAKHIRVRIPPRDRPATTTQRAAARVRAASNGSAVLEPDDLTVLRQFVVIVPRLAQALARVADFIEAGQGVDAAMADKARRYDELQALLK